LIMSSVRASEIAAARNVSEVAIASHLENRRALQDVAAG
jgi:hypothetical protein